MSHASSKVQQLLSVALQRIQNTADLTPHDAERVRQFAIRLISEFSVAKAKEEEPRANPLPSQLQTNSASKVQEILSQAMRKVQKSPDLNSQDAEWVRQFAIHLIAEFSVMKAEEPKNKTPIDPQRVARVPGTVSSDHANGTAMARGTPLSQDGKTPGDPSSDETKQAISGVVGCD